MTITDNLSHVTHVGYDSQGRSTSLTDALGNETDVTYNLIGQPVTTTYPATGQTGSGWRRALTWIWLLEVQQGFAQKVAFL